jgi:hypothetical protein
VHGVLPGVAEGDGLRWRPECGRWRPVSVVGVGARTGFWGIGSRCMGCRRICAEGPRRRGAQVPGVCADAWGPAWAFRRGVAQGRADASLSGFCRAFPRRLRCGQRRPAHVAWGLAGIAPRVRGGAVPGAARLYRCMGSCLGIFECGPAQVEMRHCWTGLCWGCCRGGFDAGRAGLLTLHGVSSAHAAVFATAKRRIFNRRCTRMHADDVDAANFCQSRE